MLFILVSIYHSNKNPKYLRNLYPYISFLMVCVLAVAVRTQLRSTCTIIRGPRLKVWHLSGICCSHNRKQKCKSSWPTTQSHPLTSHWPKHMPWTSQSQWEVYTSSSLDALGMSHENQCGHIILLQGGGNCWKKQFDLPHHGILNTKVFIAWNWAFIELSEGLEK